MLIAPAIIGLVVFIVVVAEVVGHGDQAIGESGESGGRASNVSGWFSMIYAILMMLW